MSTDSDMYAERENVLIWNGNELNLVHYDSLIVGSVYAVPLISGSMSVYRKNNLFDDELIEKVKSESEAIHCLIKYGIGE